MISNEELLEKVVKVSRELLIVKDALRVCEHALLAMSCKQEPYTITVDEGDGVCDNTEHTFKVGDWVKHKRWAGSSKISEIDTDGRIWFGCAYGGLPSCFELAAPEPEINWNVRPKFEDRDECWIYTKSGNIISTSYSKKWFGDDVYRTKQEATWYNEQRKLIIEMEDFIGFDDLDWSNDCQAKCYFVYRYDVNEWIYSEVFSATTRGLFPPCIDSYTANKTLDKFKDRLHYLLPYDGRNE